MTELRIKIKLIDKMLFKSELELKIKTVLKIEMDLKNLFENVNETEY